MEVAEQYIVSSWSEQPVNSVQLIVTFHLTKFEDGKHVTGSDTILDHGGRNVMDIYMYINTI